jgi:hypothetical protein
MENGDMETWRHQMENRKWETEAQAIFLNPFNICLKRKRKFVVCPFIDEETNVSYLFSIRLNGLA